MIYLFIIDDSLTTKRFTTSTEQLTKCCESLQKMVRLGACKIDLTPHPLPQPQLFYILGRSKAILLLWFYLFYVLESNFCAV